MSEFCDSVRLVACTIQKIPMVRVVCHGSGMRKDVEVRLEPGDRERLEAVLADHNNSQKHAAPPAPGVPALSQPPRTRYPGREAGSCHPRQFTAAISIPKSPSA